MTVNGPLASMAIGQINTSAMSAGTGPSGLNGPVGTYYDGTRFYVADSNNRRVLVWNTVPSSSGAPADYVIGQPDFNTVAAAPTTPNATQFGGFTSYPAYTLGMTVINGYLYVPDTKFNRILGFNLATLANGMAATQVIGQKDFVSKLTIPMNSDGSRMQNLALPSGIVSDASGGYIWINDTGNQRVIRMDAAALPQYTYPQ